MKLRLKLRTIIITINLFVLLLPLGGVVVLRMYENMLIWKTEESLIHQAAFINASYGQQLLALYPNIDWQTYGNNLPIQKRPINYGPWKPLSAELDLSKDIIYGSSQGSKIVSTKADPIALKIGQLIQPLLKQTQLTTLSGMVITDNQGIIVSATNSITSRSLFHQLEIKKALVGQPKHLFRKRKDSLTNTDSLIQPISRSSSIKIYVAHPIIINKRIVGSVLLIRTPPDVMQSIEKNFSPFIRFFIGLFLLVIALSAFTAYAITRPIQVLSRQAKKATSGELVELEPLEHPVTVEFEQLSKTLVQMVHKQNSRADYIKNFAAHVSHEFKSPLTSIEGAIEIIQDHDAVLTAQEREKFLMNIKKDTERMRALISQLNELAKADVVKIATQKTYLVPIIKGMCHRYLKKFDHLNINTDREDYLILMEPEIIEGVLSNLLENSLNHQAKNINISLKINTQFITLIFSDDGEGIPVGNAKKIFEPFFTTKRNAGSTGLGLPIIKSLMHAHNGSIELHNEPMSHGCKFILKFNLN